MKTRIGTELHPPPRSGTLLRSFPAGEIAGKLELEVSVVKIRLKRFGRKNHAFWRINAVDHRAPRDGKVLEELGFYDPTLKEVGKQVIVDKARVDHWLKQGAQPSDTVKQLLKRAVDSGAVTAAAPTA